MMSLPRVLLVDGHSVIFSWPDLVALHRQRSERARNALVRSLTAYQDATDVHVVVVFDGQGKRVTQQTSDTQGIQIFYSRTHQTADSVIEKIVAKYAKSYHITVATDDHLERQTALSLGGEWMSTQQLHEELQQAENRVATQIAQLRKRDIQKSND